MACRCSTKTASNCQSTCFSPFIDSFSLVTCTFQSSYISSYNFLIDNKLSTSDSVRKEASCLRNYHSINAYPYSRSSSFQISSSSYRIVDKPSHLSKKLVKFLISLISLLFICSSSLVRRNTNFFKYKEFFFKKLKRKINAANNLEETIHKKIYSDLTFRVNVNTNNLHTLQIVRSNLKPVTFHKTNFKNRRLNQLSIYRLLFLWPFIFLVYLFSNSSNLLNCSIKNGTFQLLIIFNLLFSNLAVPIADNRNPNPNKISIQGDLILGGIFPIHQKGKLFKDSA